MYCSYGTGSKDQCDDRQARGLAESMELTVPNTENGSLVSAEGLSKRTNLAPIKLGGGTSLFALTTRSASSETRSWARNQAR